MKNPLRGFKLGEPKEQWQKKLENYVSSKDLKKMNSEHDAYLHYFQKGDEKIYSNVYFNIDGFQGGGLRSVTFHLSCSEEDSIKLFRQKSRNPFFLTTGVNNQRKKEEIDKLVSWMVELYGLPSDTIDAPTQLRYYNSHDKRIIRNLILGDYNPIVIWQKKKFSIELLTAEQVDNSDLYTFAVLNFKVNSFNDEIHKLTQDALLNVKPHDIVSARIINVAFPDRKININGEIFDKEIEIEIGRFQRFYSRELPNNISKIKFDVIFQDEFQDEIFKVTDVNLTFDSSLESYLQRCNYYKTGTPMNEYFLSVGYNLNGKDYEKINKVNQLRMKGELFATAEIKAIIFEDGQVYK